MNPSTDPGGVPAVRVRRLNNFEVDANGHYVLYWMTASRRCEWNFSLEFAVGQANQLGKSLVVFEALRCGYPWASDRLHWFIVEGMLDNQKAVAASRATYYGYVERRLGDGAGLLESLAQKACIVVSDDSPSFFLPRMHEAAAAKIERPLVLVDSNGLLPLRSTEKVFSRAYDFRRFLQRELPPHLCELPNEHPLEHLRRELDDVGREQLQKFSGRWPAFEQGQNRDLSALIKGLPIDHSVGRADMTGGASSARNNMDRFLEQRLSRYRDGRMDVEERTTSELSPYLHFGHLSTAQVVTRLAEKEAWTPLRISDSISGKREGWWGMSAEAESFLDQLVTWREVGLNMAAHQDNWTRFESLPAWAQRTIAEHQNDERPYLYDLEEFENARTHDPIWNAAQRELVRDGRMHNYLRMLWGKKIYEWSPDARMALHIMIELNNKYAVDGRDPSSYSGIFWCLGRYDRAWGPERPVFGKLRYMTSGSTKRKMKLDAYLARYGEQKSLFA